MHAESRSIIRTCALWLGDRRVTLLSLAVLAWWVIPLTRPRGSYGGFYRVLDLEVGILLALTALASAAVAAAPHRMRPTLALRLGMALSAVVITVAMCDLGYVIWSVHHRHFGHYSREFTRDAHGRDPERERDLTTEHTKSTETKTEPAEREKQQIMKQLSLSQPRPLHPLQ